jgi:hypothetical protein
MEPMELALMLQEVITITAELDLLVVTVTRFLVLELSTQMI